MGEELPPNNTQDGGDKILQATLTRTIRTRQKDTSVGKCRMSGVRDPSGSGVGKGSGKQLKNRARKEVTQVELRQFRQQFQEAKQNEDKSWVDNDVCDLTDLRKHPARNFVKGRWVLTVKRDKDGKTHNM